MEERSFRMRITSKNHELCYRASAWPFSLVIKFTKNHSDFINEANLQDALNLAGIGRKKNSLKLLIIFLKKHGCVQKKKYVFGKKGFVLAFTGCLFKNDALNLNTIVKITGSKKDFIKMSSLKIALSQANLKGVTDLVAVITRTKDALKLFKIFLQRNGCVQKKKYIPGKNGSAVVFTGCLFENDTLNFKRKVKTPDFTTLMKITGCKSDFVKKSSLKVALKRAGLLSCRKNVNLLKDYLIKFGCCQKKKRLSSFVGEKGSANCFIGCLFLDEVLNLQEKPNLLNFSTVVKITGCKNDFIKGSSLKTALKRASLASCRQNVNLLKDYLIKLGCSQKKKRLSSFVGEKEFVNCFIGCLFLNESLNFFRKV